MTSEEAKAYGIIDDILSSRTAAEMNPALLRGEPQRLAEAEAEAEASPVEKPDA